MFARPAIQDPNEINKYATSSYNTTNDISHNTGIYIWGLYQVPSSMRLKFFWQVPHIGSLNRKVVVFLVTFIFNSPGWPLKGI